MRRSTAISALPIVAAVGFGGCSSPVDEPVGETTSAVAHPGHWQIPASTVAKGDTQYVKYTPAGLWENGSNCYGSLTPGAAILRKYLLDHFAGISSILGYSCDQGTVHPENMGIHGTGRAIDVMIPLDGGDADNDLGDPIGNFLIENAQLIGIQYIIWDQVDWVGSHAAGDKVGAYTGTSNPHKNHLHIELSVETSKNTTNWFENAVTPPEYPRCSIASTGAVIDDNEACITYFGSSAYWRKEQGVGYGGGLHWTNAFDSDKPGNWARWNLTFAQAGSYLVEIYLEPAFAVATGVRYEVRHSGVVDTLVVNQSAGNGWVQLGTPSTYDFAAGSDQWIAVYDDKKGVADDQHIAVDALRLTPQGAPPVEPDAGGAAGSEGEAGEAGAAGNPGPGGSGGAAGTAGASGGSIASDAGTDDEDPSKPPADGAAWDYGSDGGCALSHSSARSMGALALFAGIVVARFGRRRRNDRLASR